MLLLSTTVPLTFIKRCFVYCFAARKHPTTKGARARVTITTTIRHRPVITAVIQVVRGVITLSGAAMTSTVATTAAPMGVDTTVATTATTVATAIITGPTDIPHQAT